MRLFAINFFFIKFLPLRYDTYSNPFVVFLLTQNPTSPPTPPTHHISELSLPSLAMSEDPRLAKLLARRAKEPSPPPSMTSPTDSLNLSFGTGLEDEEAKEKIAYLSYNAETLEEKNSELEEENQRLRGLLRTRENDLFKLKNDMDELKHATGGNELIVPLS